ncbi:MAG: universal stress protein [Chloroflexi bacterium]|nr:universal stress protein [Chloroflexota bacterium]
MQHVTTSESLSYQVALRDFHRARQQAAMRQLMTRLSGKSADLLAYEVVAREMHVLGTKERGVQEIPLDKIVGSVGRYKDFTRDFLPKQDSDAERWARVRAAVTDMRGLPPIEVYQVGEIYFVKDGNHRVSVARQLRTDTISAFVTEVETRVPLEADDDPNEVICKARYADFLEKTNLDKHRPDANVVTTFCGRYWWFLDQIEAHRLAMCASDSIEESEVTTEEAAVHWYDHGYLPVIELMRELGVIRNFPQRREADLYLLMHEHQDELEKSLGWEIDDDEAASDMAEQEQERRQNIFVRIMKKIRDALIPPELEEGPTPGEWRKHQLAAGRKNRLFSDYLIALRGSEADWNMLDLVIPLAQRENDRLLGLHVVSTKDELNSPRVQALRDKFAARCRDSGLVGEFAVEVGDVTDTIIRRAAWADLVATSLTHPPGPQPLARLSHGFNRLVQKCPRPIMAVPTGATSVFGRPLLAYDGSPKSDEALYIATYFKIRWDVSLVVLTVETERTPSNMLDKARNYIERYGITDVEYVLRQKPIAEAVLETAVAYNRNSIIMGGFGHRPVKHLVLGSTVDYILREFKEPVLICR